jgi:hypothetical protein
LENGKIINLEIYSQRILIDMMAVIFTAIDNKIDYLILGATGIVKFNYYSLSLFVRLLFPFLYYEQPLDTILIH